MPTTSSSVNQPDPVSVADQHKDTAGDETPVAEDSDKSAGVEKRKGRGGSRPGRRIGVAKAGAASPDQTAAVVGASGAGQDDASRRREVELIHCIRNLEKQLGKTAEQVEAENRLHVADSSGMEAVRQEAEKAGAELTARIHDLERKVASLDYLNDHSSRELAKERRMRETAAEMAVARESEHARRAAEVQAVTGHLGELLEKARREVAEHAAARDRATSELEVERGLREAAQAEACRLSAALAASMRALHEQRRGLDVSPGVPASFTEEQWYLMTSDGKVFGPAAWDDVFTWSAQCRIAPDDRLSIDRATWVAAAEIPELEMKWLVNTSDGSACGPVNLFAVLQLVGEGRVSMTAKLRNVTTGEWHSVAEVCTAELAAARPAHASPQRASQPPA